MLSTCLLGDKAYDSDAFRAALAAQNCVAVIPSNGSRAQKLPYDKERYKARSEIECTFSLLKQARRFATRYDLPLATRRHSATTPPSSRSGALCCGSESSHGCFRPAARGVGRPRS